VDTLSELLRHLCLETRVFHREVHCGAWTLDAAYEPWAKFHPVTAGQCVLEMDAGHASHHLGAGDTVRFARQTTHRLRSVPAVAADEATVLLCASAPQARTLR
jgi:AraC family transcriptional activator of mtrCDE